MFEQLDYVIVGVSEMARSVNFYHNILGLSLKSETKEWTEFDTGKTVLALHPGKKSGGSGPGSDDIIAGTCSIGLLTSDIDKAYRELQAQGVRFVMPPVKREGEGIKLAVFLDPDGLPISLSQSVQSKEKTESPIVG